MYAIIATGGKQYKVSEGDVIKVEKLGAEAGSNYVFDQVLAVCDDALTVGTPVVEGATVEASVIGDGKARKVIVYKYKRKTGYHKKNGHRAAVYRCEDRKDQQIILLIVSIDYEIYRRCRPM